MADSVTRLVRAWWPIPLLLGIAGFAATSYFNDGIVATLLTGDVPAAERVESIRRYFDSFGAAAPMVYVAIVAIEVVVAPIPGIMLYAPGGVIFGGFPGGLLSLIGNVLGAGISCQLMRGLGRARLGRLLEGESFERLDRRLSGAGFWVILALRINPLTSSDLVSYAAGLTAIPMWKVLAGTAVGMAPLCWAQSYFAEELFEAFPGLIYPLLALCAVYAVVAIVVVRRLVRGSVS